MLRLDDLYKAMETFRRENVSFPDDMVQAAFILHRELQDGHLPHLS